MIICRIKNNSPKNPHGNYTRILLAKDFFMSTKNGYLHRLNGPALKSKEAICYYNNNLLHRLNGPARIYTNREEYYIFGEYQKTTFKKEK